MQHHLPVKGFEWADHFDVDSLMNIPEDGDTGYFSEVDLSYPDSLHDKHKDFPCAPEHDIPPLETSKFKKLLLTFNPKKITFSIIGICKNGLVITKVHRVLEFKRSDWLKKYVELNTNLRQQAKNEFEVFFFKLMINSVFGRLMLEVRRQRDVRIVTRYGAASLQAQPNFKSSTIMGNIVIIEMSRYKVLFNKTIFVGFTILDL